MWEFLAKTLPHATASLNGVAIILLGMGLYKIKSGQARTHRKLMTAAPASRASVFL